jgi:hypothetical protein
VGIEKPGGGRMNGKPWTAFELWYLQERYPVTTTEAIAVSLGRNERSVYSQAFIIGVKKSAEFMKSENSGRISKLLAKGKVHRYEKGRVPENKGKKWSEYMTPAQIERSKTTTFKKGSVPPNHKPVGYERISKDGYVEVKVKEGLRSFRLKHRVVYELHFGPIPKGYNVEFKDRDKTNCDPSNLVLRSRKENMQLNTYHNYPKEIVSTIQLMGVITRQINKHQKRLQNEK